LKYDNVNKIPVKEKKLFGHVTHRVDFKYSEETISTFKKNESIMKMENKKIDGKWLVNGTYMEMNH
jgi:hypothetical protein